MQDKKAKEERLDTLKKSLKDEEQNLKEAVILMNRKPESGKDTKVLIQKNWK